MISNNDPLGNFEQLVSYAKGVYNDRIFKDLTLDGDGGSQLQVSRIPKTKLIDIEPNRKTGRRLVLPAKYLAKDNSAPAYVARLLLDSINKPLSQVEKNFFPFLDLANRIDIVERGDSTSALEDNKILTASDREAIVEQSYQAGKKPSDAKLREKFFDHFAWQYRDNRSDKKKLAEIIKAETYSGNLGINILPFDDVLNDDDYAKVHRFIFENTPPGGDNDNRVSRYTAALSQRFGIDDPRVVDLAIKDFSSGELSLNTWIGSCEKFSQQNQERIIQALDDSLENAVISKDRYAFLLGLFQREKDIAKIRQLRIEAIKEGPVEGESPNLQFLRSFGEVSYRDSEMNLENTEMSLEDVVQIFEDIKETYRLQDGTLHPKYCEDYSYVLTRDNGITEENREKVMELARDEVLNTGFIGAFNNIDESSDESIKYRFQPLIENGEMAGLLERFLQKEPGYYYARARLLDRYLEKPELADKAKATARKLLEHGDKLPTGYIRKIVDILDYEAEAALRKANQVGVLSKRNLQAALLLISGFEHGDEVAEFAENLIAEQGDWGLNIDPFSQDFDLPNLATAIDPAKKVELLWNKFQSDSSLEDKMTTAIDLTRAIRQNQEPGKDSDKLKTIEKFLAPHRVLYPQNYSQPVLEQSFDDSASLLSATDKQEAFSKALELIEEGNHPFKLGELEKLRA